MIDRLSVQLHGSCFQRHATSQYSVEWNGIVARVALNQIAPDFSLADYRGKTVRLSDFRGVKNVLLVFNRTFT